MMDEAAADGQMIISVAPLSVGGGVEEDTPSKASETVPLAASSQNGQES